ncbi:hypothetical protein R1flu_024707 [Riccia fluitans]|uniref:NAD-dependent epimerase/dehydratase domain-containing protein n=1 Tax=Riccia fluitans TaxID=41844 RepID=A0ABD1XW40_9MARC
MLLLLSSNVGSKRILLVLCPSEVDLRRLLSRVTPTLSPAVRQICPYPLLGCSAESSFGEVRHSSSLVSPSKSAQPIRKGTGGRSSVSGFVATVFGATGFLGRYVVQQLARMGSQVFVPYRGLEDEFKHLKLMGDLGQVVPVKFDCRDEESIKAAISRSNVVINLIGRDFETHNFSFDELNVSIPDRLSRLAREHGGISRYIQVSCLGASPESPAKQYRTKAEGEKLTQENFPEATVLRPAAFVGTEDRLLNKWAVFAKKMPTVPIIGSGNNKLQPVHVLDVAAAVVAAIKDDGSSIGKTYELGGPDVFTVNELVALVFESIREEPRVTHIPVEFAKVMAGSFEWLKGLSIPTPKMVTFSRNNVDAQLVDMVVSPDALTFKDLGITPRKLSGVAIEHLYQWRTGGPAVGSTVGSRTSGAGF